MSQIIDRLYKHNAIIYKVLLFFLTAGAIVYLFPRGGQFKYDFALGKPWQYGNLYAPFDFAIYKGNIEIEKEKEELALESKKYFAYDSAVPNAVLFQFKTQINKIVISDSLFPFISKICLQIHFFLLMDQYQSKVSNQHRVYLITPESSQIS